jgi:RNA polymerase sigma-70 factor, ECF subfamily
LRAAGDYLNVTGIKSSSVMMDGSVAARMTSGGPDYQELALEYGPALARLARAYEADPELCRDLLQEIHFALWTSLKTFDGRCSLRTWVYRIAHNVGASHILKRRRERERGLISLDDVDVASGAASPENYADRARARNRLVELIRTLKAVDRQVILLYLEDLDAAEIGEVTGISAANVATKVHRIKRILTHRFHQGAKDA